MGLGETRGTYNCGIRVSSRMTKAATTTIALAEINECVVSINEDAAAASNPKKSREIRWRWKSKVKRAAYKYVTVAIS